MRNSDVAELDKMLQEVTSAKNAVPGVVLLAYQNGKPLYERCAGKRSSEAEAQDMTMNTVFWLASFSKVVTAIAVMQCVERGLLTLDDDVGIILPEYRTPYILRGFRDNEEPVYERASSAITLRHLLTHSSGLGYDLFDQPLAHWSCMLKREENQTSGTLGGITYPLLFEPGQGFNYGVGIDWAAQMVERVNHNISIEDFVQENIFKPLGLHDITFCPSRRHDFQDRLALMVSQCPDGSLKSEQPKFRDMDAEILIGGSGLYGTGRDISRVLIELISDGGRILKQETVAEMFKPQLQDPKHLEHEEGPTNINHWPNLDHNTAKQHGLGFLLNTEALHTGRSPLSAQWAGMGNSYWWADPNTGIVGVILAQVRKFGDPDILSLYKELETSLYRDG